MIQNTPRPNPLIKDLTHRMNLAYTTRKLTALQQLQNLALELQHNAETHHDYREVDDLVSFQTLLSTLLDNLECYYAKHILTLFLTNLKRTHKEVKQE